MAIALLVLLTVLITLFVILGSLLYLVLYRYSTDVFVLIYLPPEDYEIKQNLPFLVPPSLDLTITMRRRSVIASASHIDGAEKVLGE